MAYTAHVTAIDDSFEQNFISAPPSSVSGRASTLCGPRAGHWSVRSGVGSAVDDRCPTVWNEGYHISGDRDEEDTCNRAIRGDLLKRLELATIEEEKKKPAVHELKAESTRTAAASVKTKQSNPRGFYVPASVGGRELKPPARPIKYEQPQAAAVAKEGKKQKQDTKGSKLAANSAPASVARSKSQGIRITSKDGREAFVTLPYQAYVASASPTNPVSSSHKQANENKEQARASREAHAEAHRSKTEPSKALKDKVKPPENDPPQISKKQQKKLNKQAKQAQKAEQVEQAPAPSAKPVSEPKNDWNATVDVESRKSSIKDSAIGFANFFDDAPASKAPSKAPSAAVPAKSLVSAVRSISKNSEKHDERSGWFQSGEPGSPWPTPRIEGAIMTYKPASNVLSDAVSANALRRAVAEISQHNEKSGDGWGTRSRNAGRSLVGDQPGAWGPASSSPSHVGIHVDTWDNVKTVKKSSDRSEIRRGRDAPSTVVSGSKFSVNQWGEIKMKESRGANEQSGWSQGLDHWDDGLGNVKKTKSRGIKEQDGWGQGSDHWDDGFPSPVRRASTLRPWSATESAGVSMQSIRDRIKTISENSRRSGGEYATAPVRSARQLQIEEHCTRSLRVPTELWNQGIRGGSAHSQHSQHAMTPEAEELPEHDWDQPMQPAYDGFRVIGEGVVNARFVSEQESSKGIRERGGGWVCPRSEVDVYAKQHSSEPTYKHFYGNRPSSAAASEAIPRKPTVYAGLGWIEGHPLSVAPSGYGTPVQTHVGLPKGADRKLPAEHRGKKNLSFEEWREVQQSTFQAEGTVISGVGSARAPTSVDTDSVYSHVMMYTAENKPPSVVRSHPPLPAPASRGSGNSGMWSEKDGEVHLHMPWDQQ